MLKRLGSDIFGDFSELLQRGLQIFDNLGGQRIRIGDGLAGDTSRPRWL